MRVMNENLNLVEILKYCPVGWQFWSSVYGEVEFIGIYSKPVLCNPRPREDEWLGQEIHDSKHPILFDANGFEHRVSSRGEMIKGCGECTFFPSRDQRDWSKFTAPWYKKNRFDPKTLKEFDKVLVKDDGDWIWRVDIISVPADYNDNIPYLIGDNDFDWIIPYNEETKHLVGTHEEAPEYYRYWED